MKGAAATVEARKKLSHKGKGDGKSLRGNGNGDSSGNDFLARIEEAAPDTPDTPAESVFQELPSPRPSEAEGDRL